MPQQSPTLVSVRMYQVGFGDCFLLSFHYERSLEDGRSARHLLIDFGSSRWPKGHNAGYPEIAADIKERTGGVLDAVVVTHRHRDHLSGFGNDEAAGVIAGVQPRAVIRPWTDDPQAAEQASGPRVVGERSRRFAGGLGQAQTFAEKVTEAVDDKARGFRKDLRELALEQLPNQEAITRLEELARASPDGGRYLVAGGESGLEQLLPGVRASVLGPPTVDQWPQVAGQREDDPEYWLRQRGLLSRMLAAAETAPEDVRASASSPAAGIEPGPVRWLVERLHAQQTHSLLRIVRALDDALNNTSVVLLFQTGTRTLLFPGDAQIENWSYALSSPKAAALRAALPQVDLYKVGHHGSRNATPRNSLLKPWEGRERPLVSLLSTMPGVHGESEATAVPRKTLVEALSALGPLHRTDDLEPGQLALEVSASTDDENPFTVTP